MPEVDAGERPRAERGPPLSPEQEDEKRAWAIALLEEGVVVGEAGALELAENGMRANARERMRDAALERARRSLL